MIPLIGVLFFDDGEIEAGKESKTDSGQPASDVDAFVVRTSRRYFARRTPSSPLLLPQAKTRNQALVSRMVGPSEVLQEARTTPDHFEKSAACSVVLFGLAEMLGHLLDTGGKHRDLNLGRPRVFVVGSVVLNNPALYFQCQRHFLLLVPCLRAKIHPVA